jgi:hypothetical protein
MLIHIYRIYTCIRGIHPYKQCIYKPFGIAAARLSDLTAIIIGGSFDFRASFFPSGLGTGIQVGVLDIYKLEE